MIAVARKATSFARTAAYLMRGRTGVEPEHERVAWTAARNLPTTDPDLAAIFMRATAAPNFLVRMPLYQIVLSFAPDDPANRAIMERVADRILDRLGLIDHQVIMVAHRDRPHPHVHILVNRVHPETGRAWSDWMVWPPIVQVLWEEEYALGLREVSHSLGMLSGSPALGRTGSELGRDQRGVEPGGNVGTGRPRGEKRVRVTQARVNALNRLLRHYERVVELTREQYRLQRDVNAARVWATQLASAQERARAAQERCILVFLQVYRSPEQARQAYMNAANERGVVEATRQLRERPEKFGTLAVVRRARQPRAADDRAARDAAPAAAASAREAAEAAHAVSRMIEESHARRAEQAFVRELGMIYQEPETARTAFRSVAAAHGVEQAAAALRERPGTLGRVRPSISREVGWFEGQVRRAADRGIEASGPRAQVNAHSLVASARGRGPDVAPSFGAADRAATRAALIEKVLRALPDRAELEGRISYALGRLSQREMGHLQLRITGPQLAFAQMLRGVVRDIALGREKTSEEQSP